MFSKYVDPFSIRMNVGLKKDSIIEAAPFIMYPSKEIYFPNNNYFSSEELPIEWLEVIEDSQNLF
jgi:hypothetical protein